MARLTLPHWSPLHRHAFGRAVQAAGALAAIAMAMTPQAASAQDLIVKFDQASIVRLSRAASEIIVGNPSIIDVSIQSGTSMVLTGKSFGITNIIALDSQGQVIRDQRVMVRVDDDRLVVVNNAGKKSSYACTPTCAPTLTVGDDQEFMAKTNATMALKKATSEAAANGDSGGGAQ